MVEKNTERAFSGASARFPELKKRPKRARARWRGDRSSVERTPESGKEPAAPERVTRTHARAVSWRRRSAATCEMRPDEIIFFSRPKAPLGMYVAENGDKAPYNCIVLIQVVTLFSVNE